MARLRSGGAAHQVPVQPVAVFLAVMARLRSGRRWSAAGAVTGQQHQVFLVVPTRLRSGEIPPGEEAELLGLPGRPDQAR